MSGWKANQNIKDVNEVAGKGRMGAFANFKATKNEVLLVQSAISLVSVEQARLNLETEMNPLTGISMR